MLAGVVGINSSGDEIVSRLSDALHYFNEFMNGTGRMGVINFSNLLREFVVQYGLDEIGAFKMIEVCSSHGLTGYMAQTMRSALAEQAR